MAKGLRSKIMRRWRKLKRGHLGNVLQKPRLEKISNNLTASILGVEYREGDKKNAFLHPNDPEAIFPQFKPAPIIDLRSSAIPGSGRQWSGANRKTNKTVTESFTNYEDAQIKSIEQQQKQQKHSIPLQKMKEQTLKNTSTHKVRKHKSRLRKTMVF